MSARRTVTVNGIELAVDEEGTGPLVILCHGFPELAYSWRHQVPALAAAGYRVVAPDMRGYGDSSRPEAIEEYDILHLTDDVAALADEAGAERFVVVGHDWGSMVAWSTALRFPGRVDGVVGMSVPFIPRPESPPIEIMRAVFADTWFYILYFQEPGVADEDLGRDPATTLRRLYAATTGDGAPAGELEVDPGAFALDGRGFVDRLPEPAALPAWLGEDELAHYATTFARTGFTGGLNWYRNFDRNWELTAPLAGRRIKPPSLFVAGRADPVLLMSPPDQLPELTEDLRGIVLVDGAGHWVQQERPQDVTAALVSFLDGLDLDGR